MHIVDLTVWTKVLSWTIRGEQDHTNSWRTQLVIKILEAHALPAKDNVGPDTYVVFGLADELPAKTKKKKTPWLWKESTSVVSRSINPQYRCSKTMCLDWDVVYAQNPQLWRLRFECWVDDRSRDGMMYGQRITAIDTHQRNMTN
jgi:hypothetical protein